LSEPSRLIFEDRQRIRAEYKALVGNADEMTDFELIAKWSGICRSFPKFQVLAVPLLFSKTFPQVLHWPLCIRIS